MQKFSPIILRIGLSLVFLWFGSQQLLDASAWAVAIPEWFVSLLSPLGISAIHLVYFNGAFEVVFGLCLFFGLFTRVTAGLLALHMLHITYTVGYNDVGVRDFGLAMGTISVFLNGRDAWCLDTFLSKNTENVINVHGK